MAKDRRYPGLKHDHVAADITDLLTSLNLDATYLRLDVTNGPLTGQLSVPSIRLTATNDASLASTTHPFQIGPTTGSNIIADGNEIMARNNGATSPLFLNFEGGGVQIGNVSALFGTTQQVLYNSGLLVFTTEANGITVRDGSGSEPLITMRTDTGAALAQSGFVVAGELSFRNLTNGANVGLYGEDLAGTTRALLVADPDGAANVYYNGTSVLRTETGGVSIADAAGNPLLQFYGINFGTRRGFIQFTGTSVILRNEVHGGGVFIQGEDSGGTSRNIIDGDPDGNLFLRYAGAVAAYTHPSGLSVRTTVAGAGTPSFTGWEDSLGTRLGFVQFGNTGNFFRGEINGVAVFIEARDAGNTVRRLIGADPDSDVKLYYTGTETFRTADHTAANAITGAEVRHFDLGFYPVGIAPLPNVDITTSTTVNENHACKMLRWTAGAAGLDVTLANDPDLRLNAWGMIANRSGANKDIVQGTGVTIRWMDGAGSATGNRVMADGSIVTWWSLTDTEYWVWGNGLS